MTDQPDRTGGDGLLSLEDLPLYWRGRANALGLLNDRRVVPDAATRQEIETYEKCADELRAALAAPPKPAPDAMREALVQLLLMDDDAAAASGKKGNLNGVGLVDLLDIVNHPFGVGKHKQQPYRSNQLEAAIIDARRALAAPVPSPDGAGKKRGFAFPKIVIDWDQINGQQFENSRVHLMAKLERFTANKETAYWSDNHFNRSDMYVLHELLKAAIALPSGAGAAEPVAWRAFCSKTGGQMIKPPALKDLLIEDADRFYAEHGYILHPLYATPPVRGDREAATQHIGWLKMYIESMTAENWADMRLRCQRQLNDLTAVVPVPPSAGEREAEKCPHGNTNWRWCHLCNSD